MSAAPIPPMYSGHFSSCVHGCVSVSLTIQGFRAWDLGEEKDKVQNFPLNRGVKTAPLRAAFLTSSISHKFCSEVSNSISMQLFVIKLVSYKNKCILLNRNFIPAARNVMVCYHHDSSTSFCTSS